MQNSDTNKEQHLVVQLKCTSTTNNLLQFSTPYKIINNNNDIALGLASPSECGDW